MFCIFHCPRCGGWYGPCCITKHFRDVCPNQLNQNSDSDEEDAFSGGRPSARRIFVAEPGLYLWPHMHFLPIDIAQVAHCTARKDFSRGSQPTSISVFAACDMEVFEQSCLSRSRSFRGQAQGSASVKRRRQCPISAPTMVASART